MCQTIANQGSSDAASSRITLRHQLTLREVHCWGETSSRCDCQITAGCVAPLVALSARLALRLLMKETPGTVCALMALLCSAVALQQHLLVEACTHCGRVFPHRALLTGEPSLHLLTEHPETTCACLALLCCSVNLNQHRCPSTFCTHWC